MCMYTLKSKFHGLKQFLVPQSSMFCVYARYRCRLIRKREASTLRCPEYVEAAYAVILTWLVRRRCRSYIRGGTRGGSCTRMYHDGDPAMATDG